MAAATEVAVLLPGLWAATVQTSSRARLPQSWGKLQSDVGWSQGTLGNESLRSPAPGLSGCKSVFLCSSFLGHCWGSTQALGAASVELTMLSLPEI